MTSSYTQYIQEIFEDAIHQNKSKLRACQLSKIPNTHLYLNSLNLFIGKQRAGKSGAIIKELIKISQNEPHTHLLIYINKTGEETDDLFESTKHLIQLPIMYVSHQNAVEYLKQLDTYKQAYKELKRQNKKQQIPQKYMEQLNKNLFIDDLSKPFLHTLLFFEDTANSPLLKDAYIKDILGRCAHYGVSCFLASQFWKSIDPTIKANVKSIFFYGGVSDREFYYFISQVNTEYDHKQLLQQYKQLDVTDKMMIDTYTREIKFLTRQD